jgi:hypothetical protein
LIEKLSTGLSADRGCSGTLDIHRKDGQAGGFQEKVKGSTTVVRRRCDPLAMLLLGQLVRPQGHFMISQLYANSIFYWSLAWVPEFFHRANESQ